MSVDLLKHFSKVYCINLDRRTDRWEEACKEFQKWGIQDSVQRYAAVDGATLAPHHTVAPGALGLIVTLYNIVTEAKAMGYKNILILEDDVYFRETLLQLDEYMAEVPEGWNMLYLGGHHIQRPHRISKKVGRGVQIFTTHSFAISNNVYDRILSDLSDLNKIGLQLDLYFSELQKQVSTFCFIPSMTGQKSSFSDIENRYTDYTDNMDENLNFDDSFPKRFLSVAIPCYEMHGRGAEFLRHSLIMLGQQTFTDFNVVISDHSSNDAVKNTAEHYCAKYNIPLLYIRKEYERDNASSNMNNAIRNSNGEYIKLLFQDDYLYDKHALQKTVEAINANPGCHWLVSACEHSEDGVNCTRPFYPVWNDRLIEGVNTISSPSVVTIKNVVDKIFFRLELFWLMDCDFYVRQNQRFGQPIYLNEITVVNRIWEGQNTNTLSDEEKNKDYEKIREGVLF